MKQANSWQSVRTRGSRWHWLTVLALLAGGILGGKVQAAAFAATTAAPPPSTGIGLLRTTVSLLLVVGLIFGTAWLLRRVRVAGGSNARMQLLAQLSLGTRERVVWLRAGERELLLGIAPGQVRTLLVFGDESAASADARPSDLDTPASTASPMDSGAEAADAGGRPSFRALLLRSLGR